MGAALLGALGAAAVSRMTRRAGAPAQRARGSTRSYVARRRAVGSKTASKLLRYRKRKNDGMRKKVVRGALGGQATFSKWAAANRASPRVRAMKKVGAANFYVTNEAAQLITTEGFQEVGSWAFQSTADLKAIATNVPAPAGINPRQYVLESCKAEYMITNSTLATMYIDIYDVVRKRDADLSISNASQNPREAWVIGVDNQFGAPGTNAYKNINSLPTDSRLLKDYFRIVQRSHIGLAQGATHRHHVMLKSNKLIDTNLLDQKEDAEDLAGHAVYTMICIYGQPASVKPEVGPTVVTTAQGAIDVVKAVRYKYTWVQDTSNNFYYTDNLSTLVGETVVSAGAGQFVPNAFV